MARLICAPICRAANKHASLLLHVPRALKRLKPLTQRASPARIKRRTESRSQVFDLDQTARLPFCVCRARCLGGSSRSLETLSIKQMLIDAERLPPLLSGIVTVDASFLFSSDGWGADFHRR